MGPMSALGQKRKLRHARVMSVLTLEADIRQREWHVRFVPATDILKTATRDRSQLSYRRSRSRAREATPENRRLGPKPLTEPMRLPFVFRQCFADVRLRSTSLN